MECDQVSPRLPAYLDDELAPPEHDAVSAHLVLCERCRTEKELLLALWGELRGLPVPRTPDRLTDKVMRLIGDEDGKAATKPLRFSRLLPVSAAVAVAGLMVGSWLAWVLLDAETEREGERSIVSTMDVFTPNPQGSFVGGYLAMLENPGRR